MPVAKCLGFAVQNTFSVAPDTVSFRDRPSKNKGHSSAGSNPCAKFVSGSGSGSDKSGSDSDGCKKWKYKGSPAVKARAKKIAKEMKEKKQHREEL